MSSAEVSSLYLYPFFSVQTHSRFPLRGRRAQKERKLTNNRQQTSLIRTKATESTRKGKSTGLISQTVVCLVEHVVSLISRRNTKLLQ